VGRSGVQFVLFECDIAPLLLLVTVIRDIYLAVHVIYIEGAVKPAGGTGDTLEVTGNWPQSIAV